MVEPMKLEKPFGFVKAHTSAAIHQTYVPSRSLIKETRSTCYHKYLCVYILRHQTVLRYQRWLCANVFIWLLFQTGIDTGTMVKSTCTTFLKTLEECMQIANRTFTTDLGTHSPPGTPPVAAIKPQKVCFPFRLSGVSVQPDASVIIKIRSCFQDLKLF